MGRRVSLISGVEILGVFAIHPERAPLAVVFEQLEDPVSLAGLDKFHGAQVRIVVHRRSGQRFAILGGVFSARVIGLHAVLIGGIARVLIVRAYVPWTVPAGDVRSCQRIVRNGFVK